MQEKYEAPSITVIASAEAVTAGGTYGDFLDASFPDNTPRGELTFS